MNDRNTIKNGTLLSNTGEKCVVMSPDLEIRPVALAVYSGYQPERGTFQTVEVGDLIFQISWYTREIKDAIFMYSKDGNKIPVPISEIAELWSQATKKHPWLNAFLQPEGRGPCFLPGIPEEEYLSNVSKRKKLEFAFSKFGLGNVDGFLKDRKSDLNLTPRSLDFNPDEYIPVHEFVDGVLVGIDKSEEWFGSDGNGKPAIRLTTDPKETRKYMGYTEDYEFPGVPGIAGWKEYKYIIRIGHGVHVSNHFSFGHSIDIWKTK